MSNPMNNCAVLAIHAITGDEPRDIVAGITGFPNEEGGPAFDDEGVSYWSLGNYLESLGWEVRVRDHQPIPWTCLIGVIDPGHCFALVDGFIHDAGVTFPGSPIMYVMVPPRRKAGGGPKT